VIDLRLTCKSRSAPWRLWEADCSHLKYSAPHSLSIADRRDPRAKAIDSCWLHQCAFGVGMQCWKTRSATFPQKPKKLSSPFHHEKGSCEAIQAPFPLLLGLFHWQWTMDGKETGCGGSNGLRQFSMVLMECCSSQSASQSESIQIKSQLNPRVFTQNLINSSALCSALVYCRVRSGFSVVTLSFLISPFFMCF